MSFREIKELNERWRGRTEVTPEFKEWWNKHQNQIVKSWKCPECGSIKVSGEDISIKICVACQVKMEDWSKHL